MRKKIRGNPKVFGGHFHQPQRLPVPHPARFIIFHKPKGYLVTRQDEKARKTVYHLLPPFVFQKRWMPIGRLDKDSRGLLLFSREGALVDFFTKPGNFEKIYEVLIRGKISKEDINRAITGIPTSLGTLTAHRISKRRDIGPKTALEVVLKEGKNRHLRRLFHALKDPKFQTPLKVLDLKRVTVGPFTLDIPSGSWRFSTLEEERQVCERLSQKT
jgi:23S rRNA pseudouridine2605 synthase